VYWQTMFRNDLDCVRRVKHSPVLCGHALSRLTTGSGIEISIFDKKPIVHHWLLQRIRPSGDSVPYFSCTLLTLLLPR